MFVMANKLNPDSERGLCEIPHLGGSGDRRRMSLGTRTVSAGFLESRNYIKLF